MKRLAVISTMVLGICLNAYCQDPIILTVTQPEALSVDAGTDVGIAKGESVVIGGNPSANYGYGEYLYLWSPPVGLNDPGLANPTATPKITTTYLLTVTDAKNCTATGEITVLVDASGIDLKNNTININCYPNPVTDDLIIETTGFTTTLSIKLFNTMGVELVSTDMMISGSNGFERLSMIELPVGIYYLQLTGKDLTHYQSIIKIR